ncbi:FtsK/SpoIIIE domain-containing protein [Curtobacterium sp. MCPF17_046]|uniref:FtsK/SpoIIIE domain-containing protein n=1 Tax=Curtobacterium sp. MCPF17_046 TaxID=2175663 RepID=UPI000D8AF582|nr:FtsK/SpoIIIE domain-containing protein [Curtobacterium sp. MCPF17_046]PYY34492.1 hypothetical protein DEJ32_14895 [Curtobacterium sp. MCPF17_046]
MSAEPSRASLRQAAEALRVAHAETLGALETELERLEGEHEAERTSAATAAERERAAWQARARNGVLTAQSRARDAAFNLTGAVDESDPLRVAELVDVGTMLFNAKAVGLDTTLELPLLVPLIGHPPLTVVGVGEAAEGLLRAVQAEALRSTAAGQLALVAHDPDLANPLAPFSRLTEADPSLVRVVQPGRALDAFLDELTATVSRVGNRLLGVDPDLTAHRRATGRQVERYTLVTFHDHPRSVTQQQHERLMTLAKVAPRHGIAMVFHVPEPTAVPAWFDLASLRALGDSIEVRANRALWARRPDVNVVVQSTTPASAASAVADVLAQAAEQARVRIEKMLPSARWTGLSVEGLTAPIAWTPAGPVDVTFGDDVVHGLVTGSSGQGKSNLLQLVIHALAARYSPDELEFYLLDMKEGVTLATMAPSMSEAAYLPHARVIGLQADQEYGLAVLQEIERVYKRRMAQISSAQSIAAYRRANPDVRMPRIVVIIDEFQLLLASDADRVGQDAAAKLLSLVKLVRAAGIHIILASQEIGSIDTLGGNVREGLLAQLKLRVGLRNTPVGSEHTFGSGNRAAADLRQRGQVVVNTEAGALDGNRIGGTPFADPHTLTSLRADWCANQPAGHALPTVFDGTSGVDLGADTATIGATARAVTEQEAPVRAFLGRPVAVTQEPVTFTFDRVPGRNLAIVGSAGEIDVEPGARADHLALDLIRSAVTSALAQRPPGDIEVVVLDLLDQRDRAVGQVDAWLEELVELGHRVVRVTAREVKEWIAATAGSLPERTDSSTPVLVVGLGLERMPPISEREGGVRSVPLLKQLQGIWQDGPTTGLHSISWWAQSSTYLQHIEKKVGTYTSGTAVLFGAEETAQRTNGLLTKWSGAVNRALYRDSGSGTGPQKLIPYRLANGDVARIRSTVHA